MIEEDRLLNKNDDNARKAYRVSVIIEGKSAMDDKPRYFTSQGGLFATIEEAQQAIVFAQRVLIDTGIKGHAFSLRPETYLEY